MGISFKSAKFSNLWLGGWHLGKTFIRILTCGVSVISFATISSNPGLSAENYIDFTVQYQFTYKYPESDTLSPRTIVPSKSTKALIFRECINNGGKPKDYSNEAFIRLASGRALPEVSLTPKPVINYFKWKKNSYGEYELTVRVNCVKSGRLKLTGSNFYEVNWMMSESPQYDLETLRAAKWRVKLISDPLDTDYVKYQSTWTP